MAPRTSKVERSRRVIDYRPLDDLDQVRSLTNAKGHDTAGIAASITRFGFVEPITLDERTGRLASGHGRLDELLDKRARGDDPPDGIDVDDDGRWLAPVVLGWASADDGEAEAFEVAANQLTIAGGWDSDLLLEQVARIQSTPLRFDGLGFDPDELEVMLTSLRTDDRMPTNDETWTERPPDTTVAFRFGDYSGRVAHHVYDDFLARFEKLRTDNDAVLLDEVLVAWLGLTAPVESTDDASA